MWTKKQAALYPNIEDLDWNVKHVPIKFFLVAKEFAYSAIMMATLDGNIKRNFIFNTLDGPDSDGFYISKKGECFASEAALGTTPVVLEDGISINGEDIVLIDIVTYPFFHCLVTGLDPFSEGNNTKKLWEINHNILAPFLEEIADCGYLYTSIHFNEQPIDDAPTHNIVVFDHSSASKREKIIQAVHRLVSRAPNVNIVSHSSPFMDCRYILNKRLEKDDPCPRLPIFEKSFLLLNKQASPESSIVNDESSEIQELLLSPRMLYEIVSNSFWSMAAAIGVESARQEIFNSDGSCLIESEIFLELANRYGYQSLDNRQKQTVTRAFSSHALNLIKAGNDNFDGLIYGEDNKNCRSPSASELETNHLSLKPKNHLIVGNEIEKTGRLCLRYPLPAVVFTSHRPQKKILHVSNTYTALGFQLPILLVNVVTTEIEDGLFVSTGIFQIPVPSLEQGNKWLTVIPNATMFVQKTQIHSAAGISSLEVEW